MRIKRLRVSGQLLVDFLKGGVHEIEVLDGGLPKDARLIRIYHDFVTLTDWMVIESSEFPDVPEGVIPDELPLITIRNRAEYHE